VILQVTSMNTYYGSSHILRRCSLADQRRVACSANGVGNTTLRSMIPTPKERSIRFKDESHGKSSLCHGGARIGLYAR
jgi:ABC-type branched-subunit amino acid transport system ATPase component